MSIALTAELGLPLSRQVIATRRDLHRFAEPGWCEFRTATKIVQTLQAFGWEVRYGREVVDAGARMGVPKAEELDRFYRKAIESGADPKILEALRGGFTGVVGTLRGDKPGPVVALRFDIDANLGPESNDEAHPPTRGGFASVNYGIHHNCGHDGHTAIGLAIARALSEAKKGLRGELRLVFQPAEEGLRGAGSMIAAGVLKGVETFIGCHVGVQALKIGEVIPGYRNILASVKLDVTFRGRNAHAAISPQVGRNALLAACVAMQNLLAIPRHGDGETRVNVGILSGGESRNSIPASATLAAELRADTTPILDHLAERAMNIVQGAAQMQGVEMSIERVGGSCGASSDRELVDLVAKASKGLKGIDNVRDVRDFKGSDDAAAMMAAVQLQGGKAVYFGLGTELRDVHHSPNFDFDERILPIGVNLFLRCLRATGTLA